MTDRKLTPHGELLDRARLMLGVSQREAARRAGVSEGRWRQVVTGVQRQGGVSIPVNPKAVTLAAMARAVGADVSAVLEAAGITDIPRESLSAEKREERALAEMVEELRRTVAAQEERLRRLEGNSA